MTLGGLKEGVTPLDMAHAYETFASGGDLIYGTLSPGADNRRGDTAPGPVGIERIDAQEDGKASRSSSRTASGRSTAARKRNVLDRAVAEQVSSLLQGVVRVGTGTRAQVADTVDRRQDRHDRGLRRRLVRRLDAEVHGRGLGRLPERVQVDGDRVPGPAGRGRHVPGRDLPDVHRGRPAEQPAEGGRGALRRPRPPRRRAAPTAPGADRRAAVRRHRRRGRAAERTRSRRPTEPAPAPTTAPPEPTPAPGGDEAPDAGVTGAAVT